MHRYTTALIGRFFVILILITMQTEFEATFWPINKDAIRQQLVAVGAIQIYPERLMRRRAFNLPPGLHSPQRWARVRDEGDRITASVKYIGGNKIEDQQEAQIIVNDFDQTAELFTLLGCHEKAFQETKRELWKLNEVEIMIDEWPFLEPLIEVEGTSEEQVHETSEQIGMDWAQARFCAVSAIYIEKYGITEERINNETPRLVFGDPNPFAER